MEEMEWGYAYFYSYRIDLLTGKKEEYSIHQFLNSCEDIIIAQSFTRPRVIHLFYELHEVLYLTEINEDVLLAIDILYNSCRQLKSLEGKHCQLEPLSSPLYEDYEKKFKLGQEELLKGNCYQFNLTEEFKFKVNTLHPFDLLSTLWKNSSMRGQYAHASYLPTLDKFYVSNSPESLFEVHKKEKELIVQTRPIKGTVAITDSVNKAWNQLKNSLKDQAELFMITDLMRNDLSKIQDPKSRVMKKKSRLTVPGLVHQYSLVETTLNKKANLYSLIRALFPGGSITGAPKKRVLEILKDLEKRSRGFYCGSTILLYKDAVAGSINIRSATIDLDSRVLSYSGGGGITLLSKVEEEYKEMLGKVQSFTRLFY